MTQFLFLKIKFKNFSNLLFFCGIFVVSGFIIKNCYNEKEFAENNISSDTSKVIPETIYGVTLENVHTKFEKTLYSLGTLGKRPTSRVVFDNEETPVQYLDQVRKIRKVSYVMGEIVDSYEMKRLSFSKYKIRVKQYVDLLNNDIDIWEAGNEINGEWNGTIEDMVNRLNYCVNYIKLKNKKTAVTFFYNKNCWENPDNEMFTWINNSFPKDLNGKIDYVFVSYYDDNCKSEKPEWQGVFDSLHTIFPNAKLGIGECGTKFPERKEEYMKRYYSMKINTPNYIGGYFWWYFNKDCVPQSNKLWKVMNEAMGK